MIFHVVTPLLAEVASLRYTIESVANQSVLIGDTHSITYAIRAADTNLDVESLTSGLTPAPGLAITVTAQPDTGMYDALVAGFAENPDADVYCYLGSGDFFSPHAMEIVADCMKSGAEWLTGFICGYNQRHHIIETQIPFRYRRALLRAGCYGRFLPYVQQESTFWNQRLHNCVDWESIAQQKYAGDALLWRTFADHAPLRVVEAWLGGFERTPGQLSERYAGEYIAEQRSFSRPLRPISLLQVCFDWLIWRAPRAIKRILDPDRLIFDERAGCYRSRDQE